MNADEPYSKAGLVPVPSTVTGPEKGGAPARAGRLISSVLSNTVRKPDTTVLYHKLLVASMQQRCACQTKMMIDQTEKHNWEEICGPSEIQGRVGGCLESQRATRINLCLVQTWNQGCSLCKVHSLTLVVSEHL